MAANIVGPSNREESRDAAKARLLGATNVTTGTCGRPHSLYVAQPSRPSKRRGLLGPDQHREGGALVGAALGDSALADISGRDGHATNSIHVHGK